MRALHLTKAIHHQTLDPSVGQVYYSMPVAGATIMEEYPVLLPTIIRGSAESVHVDQKLTLAVMSGLVLPVRFVQSDHYEVLRYPTLGGVLE